MLYIFRTENGFLNACRSRDFGKTWQSGIHVRYKTAGSHPDTDPHPNPAANPRFNVFSRPEEPTRACHGSASTRWLLSPTLLQQWLERFGQTLTRLRRMLTLALMPHPHASPSCLSRPSSNRLLTSTKRHAKPLLARQVCLTLIPRLIFALASDSASSIGTPCWSPNSPAMLKGGVDSFSLYHRLVPHRVLVPGPSQWIGNSCFAAVALVWLYCVASFVTVNPNPNCPTRGELTPEGTDIVWSQPEVNS